MLAALFKASYNNSSDHNTEGGVCGTAFFIDSKTALTAHHHFNDDAFKPNEGFSNFRYWLLLEDGKAILIKKKYLHFYPNVDTTTICFPDDVFGGENKSTAASTEKGEDFVLKGFLASVPGNPGARVKMKWESYDKLGIDSFDLTSVISSINGTILDIENKTINSPDVKVQDKDFIELSCGGNVGLSGAPLIKKDTDEIVGLMSYGLPHSVVKKDRIFAISIGEVFKEIGL
ncbi:MAG: hypothetical protein WC089_01785 [Candidatus Paceibacterota bacterium]